jgi:UDP-N-acetylmuramate dehydrogenase
MRLAKEQIDFGFRALHLPVPSLSGEQGQPIVLNAELALALSDSKQLRQEAQSIMRKRIKMQPVWEPSAGCFFRNPGPHMPAGRLIDEAGLKGVAVGDACVSQRHANFIVNNGQATAAQVLKLKAQVEAAVWRKFKIKLQPEVRIVGQDT